MGSGVFDAVWSTADQYVNVQHPVLNSPKPDSDFFHYRVCVVLHHLHFSTSLCTLVRVTAPRILHLCRVLLLMSEFTQVLYNRFNSCLSEVLTLNIAIVS